MRVFIRLCGVVIVFAVAASTAWAQTAAPAKVLDETPVRTKHAMVVTVQHDATDAGVQILHEGGNAVDAAVAVGFALAVTHPAAGNIGGGGFMLIRLRGGKTHFLDYREKAPAAATANMYQDAKGNIVPGMSTLGYKAIGVPGSVAGLAYAEKHFGKLGLKKVMAPAIKLATDGYVLMDGEAASLHARNLSQFATSKHIFQRDGNFYKAGETFKQPELAETLTRIANDPDDFYHGEIAKKFAAFMQQNGGLITEQDLANYVVKDRAPLVGNYRGYQIITAPPPSSGGIALLEILNILSGYDLKKLGADRSPEQIHLITEAFRRAYMDRGDYLGDPDFTAMPLKQLADLKYAAAWRKSIDAVKPSASKDLVRPAGYLPTVAMASTPPKNETTHFSVMDAEGNVVSSTYTLNGSYGSGVTVDGLGFALNNEMDDFTSKIGAPNMYGLIQAEANAIAPGKRPLSCMTPTIVLRNSKVRLVTGSPGGSTIMTTVANDIISVLDNGLSAQAAADAPRFHHQYLPDQLQMERSFPAETVAKMKAEGYTVTQKGSWGDSEMIEVDPRTDELLGGHDQRSSYGKADGY